MNIFEKAMRSKLRVDTIKGMLSVEQLWDLNLSTLAESLKAYNQEVKKDDNLDFLSEEITKVNEKAQLAFDVLKSIYLTKKQEQNDAKEMADRKNYNAEIDRLIFEKQQDQLKEFTIEELRKLKK